MQKKVISKMGYVSLSLLISYVTLKSCDKKDDGIRVHTPSVASAEQSVVPDWYGKYKGRKERYLNQIYNGKD